VATALTNLVTGVAVVAVVAVIMAVWAETWLPAIMAHILGKTVIAWFHLVVHKSQAQMAAAPMAALALLAA
jgi:hypothetical protein